MTPIATVVIFYLIYLGVISVYQINRGYIHFSFPREVADAAFLVTILIVGATNWLPTAALSFLSGASLMTAYFNHDKIEPIKDKWTMSCMSFLMLSGQLGLIGWALGWG